MQEYKFWEQKSLLELTDEEWELVCDGCGQCCYQKYIQKRKRKKTLFYTRIACDYLNLDSGLCGDYNNRFKLNVGCTKLTKKNIHKAYWLPETCGYKLLLNGQKLFDWHPLISKDPKSVLRANILIEKGIHEKNVIDWLDFVIDEKNL